jgi:hypothetical protein
VYLFRKSIGMPGVGLARSGECPSHISQETPRTNQLRVGDPNRCRASRIDD